MKKLLVIILILLTVFCYAVVPVSADQALVEEYYRVADNYTGMDDGVQDKLDEQFIKFAKKYKVDFCCFATKEERYNDFEAFAKQYYDDYKFGYGDNRDGFVLAYDVTKPDVIVVPMNGAVGMFSDEFLENMAAQALDAKDKGTAEVFATAFGIFKDAVMHGENGEGKVTPNGGSGTSGESGDGSDEYVPHGKVDTGSLPDWYPTEDQIANFKQFHDFDAPRVVDVADIFTDAEEAEMLDIIKGIQESTNKDIVIFTDGSTYGFDRAIYAADFYDFNGYGLDDENSGMCLMICMDPNDRGWWACATGEKVKEQYNLVYDDLDDELYGYMAAGHYGEGVIDWIQHIGKLYTKGNPFAPNWIPDEGETYVRTHNTEAPRVVDGIGALTDEQREDLERRVKALSDEYGFDIILNADYNTCYMTYADYCEDFYYYHGYGTGDRYDGMMFTIFTDYGSNYIYANGLGYYQLDPTQEERLMGQTETYDADKVYDKFDRFLKGYENLLKRGRVPYRAGHWIGEGILAAIFGSIIGLIRTKRKEKKMKTVRLATGAMDYLVPGSDSISHLGDRYLYTRVESHYDPIVDDDDGGSSSSGGSSHSSHSSSYSGSSGVSHSGSGRSF